MNAPAQNVNLLTMADRLRDGFLGAQSFAHCMIDNLFTDAFARTLLDAFPAFEHGDSLNEDGVPAGKSVVEQMHALGESYAAWIDACNRPGSCN